MNFRRGLRRDEPEINFIPLLDLLLVVLIFVMTTTTFSRITELQVDLPGAGAQAASERPREIVVADGVDGRYLIDNVPVPWTAAPAFAERLRAVAAERREPVLVIYADAGATHQSVVNVLEAAQLAGIAKVSFAAQAPAGGR